MKGSVKNSVKISVLLCKFVLFTSKQSISTSNKLKFKVSSLPNLNIYYSQDFCETEEHNLCNENMQQMKIWKLPVWVKDSHLSPVLQTYLKLTPNENYAYSFEEICKQCKQA